tara:strand:+ start:536 stop:970 length:435 start_codon:yes stop_codon:yes gene_type:complete
MIYPLLWMLFCCSEKESKQFNHVYNAGKKVYEQRCAACHQSDGLGKQDIFPPLVGSQWIKKDPKLLASIIQYGLGGEINVAGVTYRSAMPPQELSEEDLYSVVAYVRFAFAKQEVDFSIDTIKPIVKQKRGTIYGQAELEELFP